MKQGLTLIAFLMLAALATACGDDGASAPGNNGGGGVDCTDSVCTLTGTILDDLTMTADKQWVLQGGVFIGNDIDETVLTIEAGTTIYGTSAPTGMLVITRGSKIMAEGTANAPIVFTSSKTDGSRARGDWGGLIINGRAPVNVCEEETDNCESYGEGGTGWYGGNLPGDNSGIIRYVRVEFAGSILSPENELNGIAFQGVGSGTTIDHVQVHMNKDDGIEFFGGTANIKYALVTGAADDGFDWTDGWQGKAQFVIVQQAEDAGDQGIEADNNAEDNEATPRSHPTLSNFTLVGSPDNEESDIGILLREGTAANIYNTIVVGFNDACLDIDNAATFDVAMSGTTVTGDLTYENTIVSCARPFKMNNEKDEDENPIDDPWSLEDFFMAMTGNLNEDPKLTDAFNQSAPNFAPASDSPALGAAVIPEDGFFEDVDYIGAMGPDADWTEGWTSFDRN